MCLLIFKKENEEIPYEHLVEADRNNPHGCGISWADGSSIQIEKGDLWNADNIAERLGKIGKVPAIVHFRWMTHGEKNEANTHPFKLPKGWSAAHNGIISGVDCYEGESDTRAFLRENVTPIIDYIIEPEIQEALEKRIGINNKMAFLHSTGEWFLLNEKIGHWKDGIWYSNYGYRKPTYHKTFTNYRLPPPIPTVKKERDWLVFDKEDLRCQNCGFGFEELAFGAHLKIGKQTGAIICTACYPG